MDTWAEAWAAMGIDGEAQDGRVEGTETGLGPRMSGPYGTHSLLVPRCSRL